MAKKVVITATPKNGAAKIKNSQGTGGGLSGAAKGGAKFKVSQGTGGGGLKQAGTGAKTHPAAKRGINALNKAPIVGVTPRVKPAKIARNSVASSDVKRIRTASQLATPKTAGGGFKKFIGGN